MTCAIAHDLKGFRSTSLRVRVERIENGHAWVRTADLLDAGTPLVLRESQLAPEAVDEAMRHKTGLVAFA